MIRFFILLFLFISCGKPIEDKSISSSSKSLSLKGVDEEIALETTMFLNYDFLPQKGSVERRGRLWTGDSWPLKNGAINYRWNSPGKETFGYRSPDRRQIGTLSLEELKTLSPSEKYDLWMGNYDYPLKQEVETLARSGTLPWEGLCHGFAGASINHEEPSPKVMINPDGFLIPFGSSDVKALLTYAYSKVLIRETESLGHHCEDSTDKSAQCQELSAMSFHIVITNKIGLRGQSIIADLDRSDEVWNHPVIGYEIRPKALYSNKYGRRVELETEISYVDVTRIDSWEKQVPLIGKMTVQYELSLDRQGNIVNGKWLSKMRPDFLWTVERRESFDGYLSGVMKLLQ